MVGYMYEVQRKLEDWINSLNVAYARDEAAVKLALVDEPWTSPGAGTESLRLDWSKATRPLLAELFTKAFYRASQLAMDRKKDVTKTVAASTVMRLLVLTMIMTMTKLVMVMNMVRT